MANAKGSRGAFAALLVGSILAAIVVSPAPARAAGAGRRAVTVLVPDAHDLRLLAFWVALGAGDFASEGLDVHVSAAASPAALRSAFVAGAAPVALLSGTEYERLISDRFPFVLAANLLQNDPTELVIRRDVASRLGIRDGMPVAERLSTLRGVSIGVAVPDRARLHQLFRSQGGDVDIATLTVAKGGEQVHDLDQGELDAAYLATPYVEQALERNAIVLVDAAGGEIPTFAERIIEALAVTSAYAQALPGDVAALVRGIAKAEHTIRFDPKGATEALVRSVPTVDRSRLARIVALYGRAVPATPHVEAALLKREAAFYPVGGDVLNLTGVDFQTYVLAHQPSATAGANSAASSSSQGMLALLGALALVIALLVVLADQREPSRKEAA